MLAATVVAPGHAKIVPLMPEFIAPQDGSQSWGAINDTYARGYGEKREHDRLEVRRGSR
jgi:hypothetical protein